MRKEREPKWVKHRKHLLAKPLEKEEFPAKCTFLERKMRVADNFIRMLVEEMDDKDFDRVIARWSLITGTSYSHAPKN